MRWINPHSTGLGKCMQFKMNGFLICWTRIFFRRLNNEFSLTQLDLKYRMRFFHKYTREIPEPAPFLSWHGSQIGSIRVFPTIKITMIRQVRMYWSLTVKINTREMPHKNLGHILFAFIIAHVYLWIHQIFYSSLGFNYMWPITSKQGSCR